MNRTKLTLLIVLAVMAALFTVAAKPDPSTIPGITICDTHFELLDVQAAGVQPFCWHKIPQSIYVFAPARYDESDLPNLNYYLRVMNRSFDRVEPPCEWLTPDVWPGAEAVGSDHGWEGWNSWPPTEEGRALFLTNHFVPCTPGSYFLELTIREIDPDSGREVWWDSWLRRWTINENGDTVASNTR